jgi:uncharacterized damage-inducible protein DinB
MRRKLAVMILGVWAYGNSSVTAEIRDLERQRLIAHLEMTASWLVDEVSGLSDVQLRFRPAPGKWSVAQVLEHLVVVAPIYWDDLRAALKHPSRKGDSGMTDADVLWYGIDRTQREEAIPAERPAGDTPDVSKALETYRKHHERLVQYVKTTRDDLRGHIVKRQGCDAYQWALLISTHEQRHILQIREIKAHPEFPKGGMAKALAPHRAGDSKGSHGHAERLRAFRLP